MNKRLKILIGVFIVLILVFAYVLISPKISFQKKVEISEEQVSSAQGVLQVLSFVNTISLDTDFFENPTFKSLTNFSVQLPEPVKGKINPFAPQ